MATYIYATCVIEYLHHEHSHTFDIPVYDIAAMEVSHSLQDLLGILPSQHLRQWPNILQAFLYRALQRGHCWSQLNACAHTHGHMHTVHTVCGIKKGNDNSVFRFSLLGYLSCFFNKFCFLPLLVNCKSVPDKW